jgi:peptidyl-tRNA hydrolase
VTGPVTPADPRDAAPQRVLPLVVRVERADPPTRTDALEAAAIAVLTLLSDPRSHPAPPGAAGAEGDGGADGAAGADGAGGAGGAGGADGAAGADGDGGAEGPGGARGDGSGAGAGVPAGVDGRSAPGVAEPAGAHDGGGADAGEGRPGEWADAMREWADARIRKVVRRARGAEWRRAEALDGITVAHRTAEVRVFPPVPLDGWPRDLARLQVSGTDLTDPAAPPPAAPGVPVLWLSPHVALTAGKAMAQVGHAAQLGWNALSEPDRDRWQAAGFPLAVRTASAAAWTELVDSGLPLVRDAGFTEIAPGACTAVADHPALRRRRSPLPTGRPRDAPGRGRPVGKRDQRSAP